MAPPYPPFPPGRLDPRSDGVSVDNSPWMFSLQPHPPLSSAGLLDHAPACSFPSSPSCLHAQLPCLPLPPTYQGFIELPPMPPNPPTSDAEEDHFPQRSRSTYSHFPDDDASSAAADEDDFRNIMQKLHTGLAADPNAWEEAAGTTVPVPPTPKQQQQQQQQQPRESYSMRAGMPMTVKWRNSQNQDVEFHHRWLLEMVKESKEAKAKLKAIQEANSQTSSREEPSPAASASQSLQARKSQLLKPLRLPLSDSPSLGSRPVELSASETRRLQSQADSTAAFASASENLMCSDTHLLHLDNGWQRFKEEQVGLSMPLSRNSKEQHTLDLSLQLLGRGKSTARRSSIAEPAYLYLLNHFDKKVQAATCIQRAFRAYKARLANMSEEAKKKVERRFRSQCHQVARKLQSMGVTGMVAEFLEAITFGLDRSLRGPLEPGLEPEAQPDPALEADATDDCAAEQSSSGSTTPARRSVVSKRGVRFTGLEMMRSMESGRRMLKELLTKDLDQLGQMLTDIQGPGEAAELAVKLQEQVDGMAAKAYEEIQRLQHGEGEQQHLALSLQDKPWRANNTNSCNYGAAASARLSGAAAGAAASRRSCADVYNGGANVRSSGKGVEVARYARPTSASQQRASASARVGRAGGGGQEQGARWRADGGEDPAAAARRRGSWISDATLCRPHSAGPGAGPDASAYRSRASASVVLTPAQAAQEARRKREPAPRPPWTMSGVQTVRVNGRADCGGSPKPKTRGGQAGGAPGSPAASSRPAPGPAPPANSVQPGSRRSSIKEQRMGAGRAGAGSPAAGSPTCGAAKASILSILSAGPADAERPSLLKIPGARSTWTPPAALSASGSPRATSPFVPRAAAAAGPGSPSARLMSPLGSGFGPEGVLHFGGPGALPLLPTLGGSGAGSPRCSSPLALKTALTGLNSPRSMSPFSPKAGSPRSPLAHRNLPTRLVVPPATHMQPMCISSSAPSSPAGRLPSGSGGLASLHSMRPAAWSGLLPDSSSALVVEGGGVCQQRPQQHHGGHRLAQQQHPQGAQPHQPSPSPQAAAAERNARQAWVEDGPSGPRSRFGSGSRVPAAAGAGGGAAEAEPEAARKPVCRVGREFSQGWAQAKTQHAAAAASPRRPQQGREAGPAGPVAFRALNMRPESGRQAGAVKHVRSPSGSRDPNGGHTGVLPALVCRLK